MSFQKTAGTTSKWLRNPAGSRISSSEGPLCLDELKSNLFRRYKMLQIKGLPWMDNVRLSLQKHFVELEMKTENENNIYLPKKKIKLHQLFQSTSPFGEAPSRILLEGNPGFGKTTLATKLCFDFRKQREYIMHFDLVLFFSLKLFSGNLEAMLCNAAGITREYFDDLYKIISSKSVKTLLILDGFDEVQNEHVDWILALIRGEIFPNIVLIVTSRPGRFTSSANRPSLGNDYSSVADDVGFDMTQMWDKHTKITGIGKERQTEFIDKHLSNLPANERQTIKERIQQMRVAKMLTPDFFQCPLFILMIVLLLSTKQTTNFDSLKTRTDLYKGVMNFVMRRYLSRISYQHAAKVDLFSFGSPQNQFAINLMTQLGEFSLTAVKANNMFFTRDDVLGLPSTRDPRILDMGVLTYTTSVRGFLEEEHFEPVHKTLLEFAAAYFLWAEFKKGRRNEWKKRICQLKPTYTTYKAFILFPFLAGLMGADAVVIFDALRPYAAEYSSFFDVLTPTLCEIVVTDSILQSLLPYLPPVWWNYWSYSDILSSALPSELMAKGLEVRKIKEVMWYLEAPVRFSNDVEVEELTLLMREKMRALTESRYKLFKCIHLQCEFAKITSLGNKWVDFLPLLLAIQFQHISFWLSDSVVTLLFFPLIYNALGNGELRTAKISCLKCELSEETIHLLDMLIELIQLERVCSVCITFGNLPDACLSKLFTAISKSSCLTDFIFYNLQVTHPVTIDLAELCHEEGKSYGRLHIFNAKVKCSKCMGAKPPHSSVPNKLSEICATAHSTNLSNFCRVRSFCGDCSILINDNRESVSSLNITVYETLFNHQIFDHFKKFQNLQVLTLSMTPFMYQSPSDNNWISTVVQYWCYLKTIEISSIENNLPFATEIVNGLSEYLEERSSVSPVTETKQACSDNVLSKPKNVIQNLCLKSSFKPDVLEPSTSDAVTVSHIMTLVARLKQTLVKQAVTRLDIVVMSLDFIRYLAKFHPNGVTSILDMFPFEEDFTVKHDFSAMTADDSLHYNLYSDSAHTRCNRFSVSLNRRSNT